MDFTREPIIETVITPKDGFKLAVRSSKNANHEEYFVDAVEVVTFGGSSFFRSLERPKSFLVPVSDYEVLEVREARLVLKNVGIDRSIKIGGGREGMMRPSKERESVQEKSEPHAAADQKSDDETDSSEPAQELRNDRKRDRRRQQRRRRDRIETDKDASEPTSNQSLPSEPEEPSSPSEGAPVLQEPKAIKTELTATTASILSTLLPPPSTLISETIARYRENDLFKGAFFLRDEPQPEFGNDEFADEEESSETPPAPLLSEQLTMLSEEPTHEEEPVKEPEPTHLEPQPHEEQNS